MKLNQTTIGELYAALTSLEIKQLGAYLDEKPNDKVKKLHQWMVKLTKENKLKDCDTDFLVQKILGENAIYSSYTTLANLLINHIKDYLILSKTKEKNIFTEALWGDILIERGLRRNLLLKLTNFRFELYKDSYALFKKFLNEREKFFYQYITLTKKNYAVLINSQFSQIEAFNNYRKFYYLELISSLSSLSKQQNRFNELNSDEINTLIEECIHSENDLIKIQALSLNLILDKGAKSYYELMEMFKEKHELISKDHLIQLVPNLLNYGAGRVNKGFEEFELENYRLLSFLNGNNKLIIHGVFSIPRLFAYIRLELRYGTIEKAEQLLAESLKVISPAQKDSFQYLIESRISFAKKDYKLSLRKISIINPSDSIYYFPQYKIMLIKNYIILADIDRLMAERENFYKYLNNQKNIQEDEKRRHKLFIKYTEYLTNARYEYLTDYMKKRIENALLQTSPYFSEKHWVRERWEELKGNS
jgi:hypothetical protein